jgi:hypothetical protein
MLSSFRDKSRTTRLRRNPHMNKGIFFRIGMMTRMVGGLVLLCALLAWHALLRVGDVLSGGR